MQRKVYLNTARNEYSRTVLPCLGAAVETSTKGEQIAHGMQSHLKTEHPPLVSVERICVHDVRDRLILDTDMPRVR